jgi:hypothetical protein
MARLRSSGPPVGSMACLRLQCFQGLFEHGKKKNRTVAEAMHNDTWIADLTHDVTTSIFGDYVMLWIMVEAASFNPLGTADDQITWTRAANGRYSAKSAYLLQFEGCVESSFQKQAWEVWAPSRCKFFIWLLLQNRIWTADRLLAREWPNQYFCPLYRRNLEMAGRLFLAPRGRPGRKPVLGYPCRALTHGVGRGHGDFKSGL